MADKTKSQTFQQMTLQQNIKDILNEPNIALKERHGGVTIKFNDDIISKDEIFDNLNNIDKTKEVAIVSRSIADNNFIKYSYNCVTILEHKKIRNLRKKIFTLEKQLKLLQDKTNNLNIKKNNNWWFD